MRKLLHVSDLTGSSSGSELFDDCNSNEVCAWLYLLLHSYIGKPKPSKGCSVDDDYDDMAT
jgi:hypothetical protein